MRKLFLLMALFAPMMLASCGDDDDNGNPTDTTDPEIAILQPGDGGDVPADHVLIRAQATDNQGIDKVEFYVDGIKIGEDAVGTAGIYEFTWNACGLSLESNHTLRARAIDTSGNDAEDSIGVTIGIVGTIHGESIVEDETWAPSGNPHVVTAEIQVWEGATLTILPGCTVEFATDVPSGIGIGWEPLTGSLVAEGTAQQPILFTSQACSPQRGDWRGLDFYGGTMATTHLSYCTIEYAGYSEGAAVYVSWGAAVRMDHCTIRQSGAHGISYEHSGHVEQFHDNTITTCADYPLVTEPEYVRHLGTGNSFTGNDAGKDKILLDHGVVVTSGTWRNQGVPYEVSVVNEGDGIYITPTEGTPAILTIEAGTTIRLGPGAQVLVGYGGSLGGLVAVGTEQAPITFTSASDTPQPGDWHQISLADGAVDAQTRLEHCVIEYGGGAGYGNLSVVDALPTVSNCAIGNGASHGIYLAGYEHPDAGTLEANNTFYDLAGANVYVEP